MGGRERRGEVTSWRVIIRSNTGSLKVTGTFGTEPLKG